MSDDQSLHAPQAGLSLAVSSLLVRLARGRHHRTSRANCKSEMEADGSGLLRAVLCLGGWRKVQVFGYPLRQGRSGGTVGMRRALTRDGKLRLCGGFPGAGAGASLEIDPWVHPNPPWG
jgi:hypothetical protein